MHGVVKNWDALERLLEHAYSSVLGVASQSHPLLLADSPVTSDQDRARMAELLFEKFNVPAYFVGTDAVLSVYSAGRTSSLLLDCGHGLTSAMLVHDGFIYPSTLQTLAFGGQDVSAFLLELLGERGLLESSAANLATANDIKENHARVALDFAQESFHARSRAETYTLPDGRTLALQAEPLRCSEALFQPALMGRRGAGIHSMVTDMIGYCDAAGGSDDSPLKGLTNFLLVCGGGSFLPGLEERIVHDVASRYRNREFYASCLVAPERQHAAWIGGSILASLPAFVDNNFVSQGEYREEGAGVVHQKCS